MSKAALIVRARTTASERATKQARAAACSANPPRVKECHILLAPSKSPTRGNSDTASASAGFPAPDIRWSLLLTSGSIQSMHLTRMSSFKGPMHR